MTPSSAICVRRPLVKDLSKIDEIYRSVQASVLDFPDYNNVINDIVVERDEKLLAYGMIKFSAEATMILDTRLSLRNRMMALRELVQTAIISAKRAGLDQFMVTTEDPRLAQLLIKHFHFSPFAGQALVIDFSD